MTGHLWSGRFDAAPDPAAFDFGVSFPFDRRLFEDDVTGSLAWAEALARAGGARRRGASAASARASSRSSSAAAAIRRGSTATTRTSTASSNGSSSRSSATTGGACTPAARATSRCRWTSGSTCGGASRCCRQALRALVAALADQADPAGEALMPAYTHMRRAMPVLVAHFLLSHAAALRRDHRAPRRRDGRSRCAAARFRRHCRHRLRD